MRYQELVLETAEENQIMNLVAGSMAEAIANLADGKPREVDAKKLSPLVSNPVISQLLDDLTITLIYEPHTGENVELGGYITGRNTLQLNIPDIQRYAEHRRVPFTDILRNTLVHELQHATDDLKSDGQFIRGGNKVRSSSDDFQGYLDSPHEINARVSEFLLDMSTVIANWKKQGVEISTRDLTRLIKQRLTSNRLSTLEPQKLKRLYTRAYKFYEMELNNPKAITPDSLAERARKWIFGGGQGSIK